MKIFSKMQEDFSNLENAILVFKLRKPYLCRLNRQHENCFPHNKESPLISDYSFKARRHICSHLYNSCWHCGSLLSVFSVMNVIFPFQSIYIFAIQSDSLFSLNAIKQLGDLGAVIRVMRKYTEELCCHETEITQKQTAKTKEEVNL